MHALPLTVVAAAVAVEGLNDSFWLCFSWKERCSDKMKVVVVAVAVAEAVMRVDIKEALKV